MQIHEIAEGDEGSSEDGDDCCEEDEREEAMVHELAGELFEGRGKMRINSVRSSFKDDENNLLFDLEEDTGGSLLLTNFEWTVRNNYVLMT